MVFPYFYHTPWHLNGYCHHKVGSEVKTPHCQVGKNVMALLAGGGGYADYVSVDAKSNKVNVRRLCVLRAMPVNEIEMLTYVIQSTQLSRLVSKSTHR